jgi:hypothetical protein
MSLVSRSRTELPQEMQTLMDWWQDFGLYRNEKALMIMPVKISE